MIYPQQDWPTAQALAGFPTGFAGSDTGPDLTRFPRGIALLILNCMGDALHFAILQEGVPEDESGMRHLKIDVYAFGVTLWEMLMRQRPHGDLHAFQIQVRPPATPSVKLF